MNTTIHDESITELKEWLQASINLNPSISQEIAGLYAHYERSVQKQTGTLGVRPKTFSKELRLFLKDEINSRKVRFFYKGKPMIEGVELK